MVTSFESRLRRLGTMGLVVGVVATIGLIFDLVGLVFGHLRQAELRVMMMRWSTGAHANPELASFAETYREMIFRIEASSTVGLACMLLVSGLLINLALRLRREQEAMLRWAKSWGWLAVGSIIISIVLWRAIEIPAREQILRMAIEMAQRTPPGTEIAKSTAELANVVRMTDLIWELTKASLLFGWAIVQGRWADALVKERDRAIERARDELS